MYKRPFAVFAHPYRYGVHDPSAVSGTIPRDIVKMQAAKALPAVVAVFCSTAVQRYSCTACLADKCVIQINSSQIICELSGRSCGDDLRSLPAYAITFLVIFLKQIPFSAKSQQISFREPKRRSYPLLCDIPRLRCPFRRS